MGDSLLGGGFLSAFGPPPVFQGGSEGGDPARGPRSRHSERSVPADLRDLGGGQAGAFEE